MSRPSRFAVTEGRFGRVLIAFMALGFVALIVAAGAAAWVTGRNQEHTFWVGHTYRVELAAADVRQRLEQAEAVRRGMLVATAPHSAATFNRTAAGIPAALSRLAVLTGDNPVQQQRLARLHAMIAAQLARQRATFALVAAGRRADAVRDYTTELAGAPIPAIRALFDQVTHDEHQLLALRDRDQRASTRLFYMILSVAGALLAGVAIFSMLVVLRFTRDLAASRDQLRLLNGGLEAMVADRTADLTRANEEIQRFAYIVSHDLRSPLVNVMGFTAELETANGHLAELVARADAQCPAVVSDEARLAARDDLPEAIGFIRTSTQKMDRLINAILKLSREGRRVITPERLDLAAIARGVRDSIQHRLDETDGQVSVDEPMPSLVSDRLAIEQIVSNLVENAVKYRQPGRPPRITVSARQARGRVTIEVSDNGRGIDPRDHARVFDLFRRSGPQDQPGEGIGLAHVRALAYRLGGVIDMTSELGQGATFRVTLPAVFQDQEKP